MSKICNLKKPHCIPEWEHDEISEDEAHKPQYSQTKTESVQYLNVNTCKEFSTIIETLKHIIKRTINLHVDNFHTSDGRN